MRLRRIAFHGFALAAAFSPIAVGTCDAWPYAVVAGVVAVLAASAFTRGRSRGQHAALVVLAVALAVTLSDVVGRAVLSWTADYRPADRFLYRWPAVPELHRYIANVRFTGPTYGDLAAAAGRSDWRLIRQIRFVTDAWGFRNDPRDRRVDGGPVDVVLLGDSFGVAAATTQDQTLASVLAREYHLDVYNLSVSRENPLQEYANLRLELPRLATDARTTVAWLLFSGNDLDEPYYDELHDPHPASPGWFGRLADGIGEFRARSSLPRLVTPPPDVVQERRLADGRRMLFLTSYADRRRRTLDDVRRHANYDRLRATFAAMEALTTERGLAVVVALVPSKEEVYAWVLDGDPPWSAERNPTALAVVVRGFCAEHGFRFVDLKPVLVDAARHAYDASARLLWWRDDSHWNAAGQRAAAAAMHAVLAASERETRRDALAP